VEGPARPSRAYRTTNFAYDGDDNLTLQAAVLPGGKQEATQYVYGVSTATGSAINSNDLLAKIEHPDKTTGAASASNGDIFTYDRLGATATFTDRNGTTHNFGYDTLGRLRLDQITTFGTGVDQSTLEQHYGYDSAGNLNLITTYDGDANIASQVLRTFNGFGQVTAEYQSHGDVVNTPTTTSAARTGCGRRPA
jgi:hypothetical protein